MIPTAPTRYVVGTVAEIPPGERRIVEVDGISIGVFNVGGTFYALRNRCPHQGAPLCRGSLKGTTLPSAPGEYIWAREGEILRCPWHGWEFDVTTGRSIFNPHRVRVRAYDVTVEPGAPPDADDDPSVDTFPVTVEADQVILHLERG
jgi:3-phenylpropionate/trans-cinnamate dioxygenase ferredoxin subunit